MRQLECHQEEIHLCGKIQFGGFLFVFNNSGCVAISENITDLLNRTIDQVLGLQIEDILSLLSQETEWNLAEIERQINGQVFIRFVERIQIDKIEYYLSIYSYDEKKYIEIEPCNETHLKETRLFYYAKYLEEQHDRAWQSLTVLIRQIIGFDRVMVYQFLEDHSGQVIAESISEDMTSLIGYRYPEFDIPEQARALYTKFLARNIADIDASTVNVKGIDPKELDLTRCSLRALSPIHLQYLRNAGMRASASFSIIMNGKLWGLVACQNRQPLHVDLAQRHLGAFLTQYAVNYYLSEHQKINLFNQEVMGAMEIDLKSELLIKTDMYAVLEKFAPQIMKIAEADGLIILHDRGRKSFGDVPTEELHAQIDQSLINHEENLYATSNFVYDIPAHIIDPIIFPGVIRINVQPGSKVYMYLFRREHVYEEIWAGKPEKIFKYDPENNVKFPSPRTSFDAWIEHTKGNAPKWKRSELSFMGRIVQIIQQAIAQRSVEIANLNKELVRSNNALDTFSYTLTHDLKNPLSSIQLAAQMILLKNDISKELLHKLGENILDTTRLITEMMDKVYQLSQSNYVAFKNELIDPRTKILSILESCKQQYGVVDLDFRLGPTIPILGERTLLYQLFLNLMGNAIKYRSTIQKPFVEISSENVGNSVFYYIKDNGIGMDLREGVNIFDIFKRLPNSQGYEGSGIGLSIVKRIIDRLNAEITVKSELHVGTTFCIEFKKE